MKRTFALMLLMAGTAVAQPISDPAIPEVNHDDITDPTKILFAIADIQLSTPGNRGKIDMTEIRLATQSQVLTKSSHGLVSGDVGKPLDGFTIYNDLSSTAEPTWVLMEVIDTDTIRVMPQGGCVDIPVSLLAGGNAYDVDVSGRYVYWQDSTDMYESSKPSTSHYRAHPLLTIVTVETTTFKAIVNPRIDVGETFDVVVRGTGTTVTDEAAMDVAVAALNAAGGGRLLIQGKVSINGIHNFTSAISIAGVPGSNAEVESVGDDGKFHWNSGWTFDGKTETAITAASQFDDTLTVPTGTLSQGDWFLVYSDDTYTGTTNSAGQEPRTGEMHQVKEIRDTVTTNDIIVFDDHVVHDYTTSPVVQVLTMLENIVVENLKFSKAGWTIDNHDGYLLDFRRCANVRVRNCHWANDDGVGAPNGIFFNYVANSSVTDCTFENPAEYASAYGYCLTVSGFANKILFADCTGVGARHIFTTGGVQVNQTNPDPDLRYGSCRHVVIDNVHTSINGTFTGAPNPGSRVPFDTHESGWMVLFQNCSVSTTNEPAEDGGSTNSNRGFQSRSRYTIFRNCSVDGVGGGDYGFWSTGIGTRFEGCTATNVWRGFTVKEDDSGGTTTSVDGCIIENCRAVDNSGCGVYILEGSNHKIRNVRFDNCGFSASFEKSCIYVEGGGTGIEIDHCSMPKESNEFAVGGTTIASGDVELVGCNLKGYASDVDSEDTGFDVLNAASATLHTETSPYNWNES